MAKYDPSKQYKWEETDEFVMDGNQFGHVLNVCRNFLAKPKSQEVILMLRAEKEMTALLSEGVESGVIKEIVEPQESIPPTSPTPPPQGTKPKVRKPKQKV